MLSEETTSECGKLGCIFGGVTAKILDFMLCHSKYDYSKQDIAKHSGVSLRHATLALEKLEKLEIVKYTRNVGVAHMYQLNLENDVTELFIQWIKKLVARDIQKESERLIAQQKIA